MNNKNSSNSFPADTWVRFNLGGSRYIGRAIQRERASVIATVDSQGNSVTYSWPYICATATDIVSIADTKVEKFAQDA
jgi:hypothetical protein